MAYLLRRQATYHFRCRIPVDLIDRLGGKTELRHSLSTTNLGNARKAAAQGYAIAHEFFGKIRLLRDMEKSPDELLAMWHAAVRKNMTQIFGLKTELDALIEIQNAGIELMVDMAKDADQKLEAVELAGKVEHAKETLDALNNFLGSHGVRMKTVSAPTVTSFLTEIYTSERRLQDDANRHVVNYVTMFARITGDKPMNTHERKDILVWVRTLELLKNSIGKSPKDAIKTIPELITESQGRQTLSETSIEKHVIHVRAFFRAAIRHYKFAHASDIDDLFAPVELSEWVPRAQKRKIWTIDQLNGLFSSPIWSGTRSRHDDFTKRAQPGPHIYRDAYWWLPVLALWTGARLEELAQLHHDDLDYDRNGIPYIKINDEGIKRTKTETSIRNVPLHPFLVSIGALDLFKTGTTQHKRIFPELKPAGRLDKFGDTFSTHFTDYRRSCELYEILRDFHSLRRTFITAIINEFGGQPLAVATLVGHHEDDDDLFKKLKKVTMTAKYNDYDISGLYRVVCLLDYQSLGLNVSHLIGSDGNESR